MSKINVLIVDDEPRIRRGVERLVQSCGPDWESVAALSDGVEALEYIFLHPGEIDLLISDIKMPEMDGLTLIKEVRKRAPEIRTLLLTGYDDFAFVQTALREGAVDYLLKPIDRELFRARLEAVKEQVDQERTARLQWRELSRDADKLKRTRQKQVLSYVTSAQTGNDLSHLGFWVDDFPQGLYLLLYISLDALPMKSRAYTEKDWQAYYYALENMIDEISSGTEIATAPDSKGSCAGWSWRGSRGEFWALLYNSASESADELDAVAETVAESIRKAIQQYTPFTVSIAYGNWLEDLYLLPGAKRAVQSLMHYRLLHGGNKSFTPMTVAEQGTSGQKQEFQEIAQLEHKLKQALAQGKGEEAEGFSKELFTVLERLQQPESIQHAVQNAVILVHSAGLEQSGAACFSLEDSLITIKRAVTLQEMRKELERVLRGSLAEMNSVRERGNAQPVEQAKAWIEEHLSGDITIRKIAEQVYMNPNYFCQYFKVQTGETILDYVTRRRMELASRLLQDPVIKLNEISLKVGYQNPKYFARLFKQWSGQTPTKYREQLQGDEILNNVYPT